MDQIFGWRLISLRFTCLKQAPPVFRKSELIVPIYADEMLLFSGQVNIIIKYIQETERPILIEAQFNYTRYFGVDINLNEE